MINKKYQYIIVGSGAGGSALAKELSTKGKSVLIIEKGKIEKNIGTFLDSLRYYDANKLTKIPKKSKEGVIIWRTFMAGGTTMVSMANGLRCLEKKLAEFDIKLDNEFELCEQELGVKQIPDTLLSQGSLKIREAAGSLGYYFVNSPKFVDVEKCQKCGHCSLGCFNESKWTSFKHLSEACHQSAEVIYETEVERVIIENGRAIGVVGKIKNQTINIESDVVILAAITQPFFCKLSHKYPSYFNKLMTCQHNNVFRSAILH